MKYQAIIDTSNKNNSHTQTFDKIHEFAVGRKLKILEVGCSSGYFGGALVNQGHEVWGVEPYEEAAKKASEILHKIHIGCIEDFFFENPDIRFDVIVFGDVLEHLVDPVSVLKQSKKFLSNDGIVVSSIPNVAHFAIRAMMLEGRWQYFDLGILDHTHLKFFTRDTIIDLFNDSGYKVLSLSAVSLSAEQAADICGLNIQKESIKYITDFSTDTRGYDFQYVVSSSPCEDATIRETINSKIKGEKGLKVLCLVDDPSSPIVDIRLRSPLSRWSSAYGGFVRINSIYDNDASTISWADVIVFQRNANKYIFDLAANLQKSGRKVVFEIDDLLTDLPLFLSHHAVYVNKILPYINKLLILADAISVSSTVMLQKFQSKNNNVFCTPNFSEPVNRAGSHYHVPPCGVTLVIASSDKVLVDVLVAPLRVLQQKYGVQVVAIGPPGEMLENFGIDVIKKPNLSHVDFKEFIASIDNGVGLIPLDSSEFSSCKTAVKFYDYSMCGIPSVCSDVLPYRQVVENDYSGVLVGNDPNDWIRAVESLLLSYERRRVLVDNARNSILINHNIDLTAKAWNKLFESLKVDYSRRKSQISWHYGKRKNRLAVIRSLASHLIKPESYLRLFAALNRHGIRGTYKRVIRR